VTAYIESESAITVRGSERAAARAAREISARRERIADLLQPSDGESRRVPTRYPGLPTMPTSALARTMELMERGVDTLNEFEQGQLSILTAAARGEIQLPPDPPPSAPPPSAPPPTPKEEPSAPATAQPETASDAPTPEPTPYHFTAADIAEACTYTWTVSTTPGQPPQRDEINPDRQRDLIAAMVRHRNQRDYFHR
jgi:hypothetical protein